MLIDSMNNKEENLLVYLSYEENKSFNILSSPLQIASIIPRREKKIKMRLQYTSLYS
jgi:hypothetical protein